MQQIKNFFTLITHKDTLIKIILIELIFVLFILMDKGLNINVDIGYGSSLDVSLSGEVSTTE